MYKFLSYLSGWGFFALFPGFFLYHFMVASLGIPPVLGGLFGPVSAVLFVVFAVTLPLVVMKLVRHNSFLLSSVMLFFLYCAIWSVANYFFLAGEDFVTEASVQVLELLVLWFSLFFVGVYLPVRSFKLKFFFVTSAFVITLILLYFYMKTGQTTLNVRGLYGTNTVSTYQGFSRSALVVFVFLISVARSFYSRMFFCFLGAIVLFFVGARSEFYAFLSLLFIFILWFRINKIKHLLLLSIVLFLLPLLIFLPLEKFTSSRQLEVLDLSSSSSWEARKYLEETAINTIIENPFLGDYVSHFHVDGSNGNYAHNFLSAWVSFGFIGCSFYLMLAFCSFVMSTYFFVIKDNRTPEWILSFSFSWMTLLLLFVSKSVFWPLPALGWGLLANAFISHRSPVHQA